MDLTMSYNPIFATVASLKPLFFNGLKIIYDLWTTWKPKTPESNKSVSGNEVVVRIDHRKCSELFIVGYFCHGLSPTMMIMQQHHETCLGRLRP